MTAMNMLIDEYPIVMDPDGIIEDCPWAADRKIRTDTPPPDPSQELWVDFHGNPRVGARY
jgi:hypothetical protein